MALSAEGKAANIQKSLNTYLYTNLVTADSLDVHWPGQRSIFTPAGATWVQVHYLLGTRRDWMGTVTSTGGKGNQVSGIISLNCCETVDNRTGISFALATLRDTVRSRIGEGVSIPVYDYDSSGNPIAGYFSVLDVNENEVQDGLSPEGSGIAIWNLSARGEYVEAL